jgi:hypothetical protein
VWGWWGVADGCAARVLFVQAAGIHGKIDFECSAHGLKPAVALLRPRHVALFDRPSTCEHVQFGSQPCCSGPEVERLTE